MSVFHHFGPEWNIFKWYTFLSHQQQVKFWYGGLAKKKKKAWGSENKSQILCDAVTIPLVPSLGSNLLLQSEISMFYDQIPAKLLTWNGEHGKLYTY